LLVLSRKLNERIIINGGTPDEIILMVVDIRGDKVRLGIAAPVEISVNREEIEANKALNGVTSVPKPRPLRRPLGR
jgi:carbon storage regulator